MTKTIILISSLFFSSFSYAADWNPQASAFISQQDCLSHFSNGKFVQASLSPTVAEEFSLFYFSLAPFDSRLPTLLYVDGGPGQAAGAGVDLLRFKESRNMNVVFFHPRGAGCSQLPSDSSYDKFIRTDLFADDIEVLRKTLNVTQWDIVFGLSYGTLLSMKYAEKYPASVSEIILEGFFNPAFPRDQFLLGLQKGLVTLYNIFAKWPEYKVFSDEQKNFVISEVLKFYQTGKASDAAGVALTDEKLGDLYSSMFRLTYVGVNSVGSMNKNGAYDELAGIMAVFYPAAIANLAPKAVFETENNFPYLSMRVFYGISVYDSMDLDFVKLMSEPNKTLAAAIGERFGEDLARVIGLDGKQPVTLIELPKNLPSPIHLTFLVGTEDGPTPIDGTKEFLKTFTGNFDFYGLTGYAHQRHFTDNCYSQIFDRVLKREELKPLFEDQSSQCYLADGFVGLL